MFLGARHADVYCGHVKHVHRIATRAAIPLALSLLACAQSSKRSAARGGDAAPPNIILVMADDQGWGDVGARGHPHLHTPTLDELHRKALRFERFYAQSSVCSPTRASVLTGRHPARCGITGANVGHLPRGQHLASILKKRGYRCGHFGKWHLGTMSKTLRESNRGGPRGAAHFAPPWERSFDVAFSTEAKVPTFDPMRTPARFAGGVPRNKKEGSPYGTQYWRFDGEGPAAVVPDEELRGDDSRLIVREAERFVRSCTRDQRPFLAVVWFHAPHLPVVGSEADLARYASAPGSKRHRHYYACLTALDRSLGQLRATLRDCGAASKTLLRYCSDNGPEGKSGAPGRTKRLRGRKRSLYEGGIRVPAFVEWPGVLDARTIETPCSTSDILPTVLSLLDIESSRPLDGEDIGPILRGERARRERPIGFEHGRMRAWTGERYKLVTTRGQKGQTVELFDLVEDPSEKRNLAETRAELRDERLRALEAWSASLRKD